MPTNDYLPFGTALGAPVLTQPSWVSATPANGRGAGILPKEYFNKAIRQPSAMASAIGDFIVGAGFDALDDGNIANLTANFISALGTLGFIKPANFTGAHQQLAASGWQDLPGGFIIQWMQAGPISGGSYTQANWPKVFPNAVFGAVVSPAPGTGLPNTPPSVVMQTTVFVRLDCSSGSDQPNVFVIAIGY